MADQEKLKARVRQRARDNFKSGLNCAESVFLALLPEVAPELPPEIMRLVTGFGSGGGIFGSTCGSLSGAIAALGLVYGRRQPPSGTPEEKKAQLYGNPGIYRIFNYISNLFQREFGTTLCRELTQPWQDGRWFTRERFQKCLATVVFMAEQAAVMACPPDPAYWGSRPLGRNLLGMPE